MLDEARCKFRIACNKYFPQISLAAAVTGCVLHIDCVRETKYIYCFVVSTKLNHNKCIYCIFGMINKIISGGKWTSRGSVIKPDENGCCIFFFLLVFDSRTRLTMPYLYTNTKWLIGATFATFVWYL